MVTRLMQGTNSACKLSNSSFLSPCGLSHKVVGSIGWEGNVGGKEEIWEKDIGRCYAKGLIHVTHPNLSL